MPPQVQVMSTAPWHLAMAAAGLVFALARQYHASAYVSPSAPLSKSSSASSSSSRCSQQVGRRRDEAGVLQIRGRADQKILRPQYVQREVPPPTNRLTCHGPGVCLVILSSF